MMEAIRPKIRLFVEARLEAGAVVPLSRDQSHYVQNVMRTKEGEPILLFNGADGQWQAQLQPVSKKQAEAVVKSLHKPQTDVPDVWFGFAPIKHGRIDFIAQKATELGAVALHPVMTARTVASRVNTGRLQANAVEAAEQCERMDVPVVREPVRFSDFVHNLPEDRLLLYGDESGHGLPPRALFGALPEAGKWAVLVGPEGGFAPEEFEHLRAMEQAHAISLGPRVMRADTAGLALMTCLMAWRGDWDVKPRFEG